MSQLIPQSSRKGIDPLAQLAELYYDVARFVTEGTLAGLLDLVEPSQFVYGSDWPFTPTPIIAGLGAKRCRSSAPKTRRRCGEETRSASFRS